MRIGPVDIGLGAGLAPMAGVTDMPFRLICHELGAAWSVSEMLSAKGYLCAPKEMRAVQELLRLSPDEGTVGLQLFGHEPGEMAEAARRLENRGYGLIDINMGCPAHKIVSGGDGSALMRDPERAGRIIRAVADAVKLPVTVKLRAGWDAQNRNVVQMCRIAEQNGASAITVHGRTRDQFYSGRADWTLIGEAARAVSIPVVGNGDIACARDAMRMMEETGCAAVAVGRAAQGNPWIFEQIACAMQGRPTTTPTFQARARMALRHLDMEEAMRGERSAVLEMRKHIAWYLAGEAGCVKLRARINTLERGDEVREALRELCK